MQHQLLRERFSQHATKNIYSKIDDKNIKDASNEVLSILKETYTNHTFELKTALTFNEIESYTNRSFNLAMDYTKRKILPDGGVIWMDKKYPILISEAKRQGTNKERIAEGKAKQATGNAIERLGKNLMGIKNLYSNDNILPFICFCWGCDFDEDTVLAKLYTLNSFFEINTIYNAPLNIREMPFTCITKPESAFSIKEMVEKMLEVAEGAIKYYTGE